MCDGIEYTGRGWAATLGSSQNNQMNSYANVTLLTALLFVTILPV